MYGVKEDQWLKLPDLNLDHGLYPGAWCDARDNCVYVASKVPESFIIEHNRKVKQSKIKRKKGIIYDEKQVYYQIERFNDDNTEWEIIEKFKPFDISNSTMNAVNNANNSTNFNLLDVRCMLGCSMILK